DWHAHPQAIAGRRVAGIGEGVEREVDAVILCEVLALREVRDELNLMRREALDQSLAVWTFRNGKNQAGVWAGAEDSLPERQHRLRDLREIVQASEGDVAVRQRGKRVDRRRVAHGRVAKVVRQAE